MKITEKIFARYGKKRTLVVTALILAGAVGAYIFFSGDTEEVVEEAAALPQVTVRSVSELGTTNTFTSVGSVAAVSEARLQTEASGRITGVSVKIGDRVAAGQVIATIEGAQQGAALLQAEGAYEAAVAGAAQSDSGSRDVQTGLTSAREAAVIAIQNSYTAVNSALINSIDPFFSNPDGQVPGLRIDGNTSQLNSERVAFQSLMKNWQAGIATISDNDINAKLTEAENNVARVNAFVNLFVAETNNADKNDLLLGQPVPSYTAGLLSQSTALTGTLQNLQAARTALASAEEAVVRAASADTSGQVSLANAQVKIALGQLRSAQSAYEKTLVRTPISGVVNALYLKAGDYAAPGQPAAIVANNNGLEITTSVNEADAPSLTIGNTVTIDDTATGTITAIAGAIDPTTGLIAVKISVNDASNLQNGSTVSLTFTKQTATESKAMTIPLAAVKMTGSGPVVFTLNDNSELTAQAVTLGAISGESVVIESGVNVDTQLVTDVRGLKEGQAVTVTSR